MSDTEVFYNPTFSRASSPFIHGAKLPAGDLLPIIPPGAQVAAQSAVDPTQAGKIPGRFVRGQWWGLGGAWPTLGLTTEQMRAAADWPTENVGLRAENWPAIDADVNSEEAARLVEGVVNFHIGAAPVRVRANSPRSLFVFRRTGDEPVRKMRLVFLDGNSVEHAVEVLGVGQQYLVTGRHPSGAAYEWRENADLRTWPSDSLTKVTAVDLRTFMDALVSEIVARGWTVTTDARMRKSFTGAGMAVADMEPVCEPELALAALRAIPNTPEALPMREDIVGLLASFKAALGKQADAYAADVLEWASAHEWADGEYAEHIWRSLTHVRIGSDKLFGLARKHGFTGAAKLDFDDDVAPPVEEAQQEVARQIGDEDAADERIRETAKRLVYWAEKSVFIVRDNGQVLSHSALNAYPGIGTAISPAGTRGKMAASNALVNSGELQLVAGQTYLPGQPQLVTTALRGRPTTQFNRWCDEGHLLPDSVTDDDVRPWLDHVEYLFPSDEDRNYLLDFMAHVWQRRGRKIRWSPIIIGNQGVGKDLFLRPLTKGLGVANYRQVEPQMLLGRFMDFYENELVIVEEVSRMDRGDIYEKMKAVISGTASDTVTVEKKFEPAYEVPNVVNFIFFSNHGDALSLSHDDRRFFVISSPATARPDSYYASLADHFYKEREGWRAVLRWLLQRDLSAFQPDARPKFTDAKAEMIESSQPYYVLWLEEELRRGRYQHRSLVTAWEILNDVQTDHGIEARVRDQLKGQAQISRALKFAGWLYRQQQVRIDGKPQRIWCRTAELANGNGDFLRARYEAEVEKKVVTFA